MVSNRAFWASEAAAYVAPARCNWTTSEPSLGIWGVPESEARILPDVAALDTIKLGRPAPAAAFRRAGPVRLGGRIVGRVPPGHGDMIRLLRASDFDVKDLVELQAPEGATTRYPYVTSEWARRWPSEEVWIARKRG